MPTLNLRDPNRPTLKQRAATLKATAARLIRKPKPLPAAGSPEALAAFGAACRAVDAASRLSDADMEALHIAPGASLWTSDKVTEAQNGDFSRFMSREIEAARATPKARLEELLILTLRRELRMAEAVKASRIRELHALVYGDEPNPVDEDEAPAAGEPDPIFALIEANRAAEAAMDAQSKTAPSTEADRAEIDAAETEQVRSWQAVYRTPPTTLAGLAALREWTMWQIERHREPLEGDGSVWADAYLSLYAALRLVLNPANDAELIALGRAFDAAAARSWEAERAHEADRCNEKRIAADKAGEPVYELGERIAPLPAHTLAGMRVKLRLAAFYGTCLPRGSDSDEEEHNGKIAIRSLYQSTPGIVLGADRYSTRIVPEAGATTAPEPDPVSRSIHEARAALAHTIAVYTAHREQEPDSDLPTTYHEAFNLTMNAFRHRVLSTHPTTDEGCRAVARLALDISTTLELDFEPNEANAILTCIAGSGPAPALPELPSGGMAALLRELEECNRRYLALPLTDEAEAEGDVLHGQHWDLCQQIDALPATSLADFRSKARAGLLALKLDTRAENEAPGSFISLAQQVMRGLSAEPSEGSVARRDLSLEAFNYAYGLDLTNVPFENLWRLYEVFSCIYDALSASEDNAMFRLNRPGQFRVSTAGGIILAAEINRMGCLRDAMALQLQARTPADEAERDARLKVLVAQEMNCEGTIHDKALLAEVVAAWGAK